MPRHERLGQSDLGDKLGDGRLAGGQPAHDPETVDVGKGLVDETELAELVGLEDGVGDRAANVGASGAQGRGSGEVAVGAVRSTAVYINGG